MRESDGHHQTLAGGLDMPGPPAAPRSYGVK